MKYGLQLYSIKNISETQGLPAALKKAAELGYDSVEFAGFFGLDSNAVKAELAKNNLEAAGIHYGYNDIKKDPKAAVEFSKSVGAYSVCIPHAIFPTAAEWVDFAKTINEYGKMFNDAGIIFGYHNHRHEFEPVDGQMPIDLILENSDPKNVFFELDTRHVVIAGKDPVEYAKKYSGRIPVLHARDTDGTADCAVGYGLVNFPEVVKATKNIGLYIVENENFGTNEKQLLDSAEYLRKNF